VVTVIRVWGCIMCARDSAVGDSQPESEGVGRYTALYIQSNKTQSSGWRVLYNIASMDVSHSIRCDNENTR
jgi:hypothetical protein